MFCSWSKFLCMVFLSNLLLITTESLDSLNFWEPEAPIRRSNVESWSEVQKSNKNSLSNHTINKPQHHQILRTKENNITKHSAKKTRFGFHDGTQIRSKNIGRQKDTSSTRIVEKIHHVSQRNRKDKIDIWEGLPFILSPYAVKEQFSQLLSELDVEFTTEVLGRTASYIDIVMFKIAQRDRHIFRAHEDKYVENEPKEKQILFIVHALSPMGLFHLCSLTLEENLRQLLSYYAEHLDKFDIYLIPIANPDGYLRARKEIYWNKNNAISPDCPGVNVDRNFDVAWNSSAQISSCSQYYPGITPFSEPESRAVRDVFHRLSHKIAAYIHVHGATYNKATFKGEAVLYPHGYTDQQSDDDRYIDLRADIDEAMKNANFKVMSVSVDSLYNWYGKVSGTSVDYAATVYGIPYAMELVMQLYQDAAMTPIDGEYEYLSKMDLYALQEIWHRVLNVTFTNIHRSIEGNENGARKR